MTDENANTPPHPPVILRFFAVCIARCLLKNPPMILLDEATSSLDAETERRLQGALDGLSRQRSVLVIAHRLGTIRNAHQILVLAGGEVVERGTHDELLAIEGGKYKTLWEIQLHAARDGGGEGGDTKKTPGA